MVAGGDIMNANAEGVDCVLGSGPAGVACASELLDCGRKVVLVDPSRRLPPERATLIEDFRRAPDRQRFLQRLRTLRRDLPPAMREAKLPFSSSYLYDDVDRYLPAQMQDAKVLRSLASGGLSAVWGATVMPMARESFRNWPMTRDEMEPFYRKAATRIDVPTVNDDLAEQYPNYGDAAPTALSEQGAQLMANLLNNRGVLAGAGITFGRSRSAVGSRYAADAAGCVYCGLCMYGCPYQAIFNASYVVDRLKSNPQFVHQSGRIAVDFEEKASNVEVHLRSLDTGAPETLVCDRLFVACGAATSLQLVVSAQKLFDRAFYLKDTQLVSIPLFLRRRCRPGAIPRANALGQVTLVLREPELCDEAIHLQIYGFNPFITDLLRVRWGRFVVREHLLRPLFDQMMVVMAYLPGQLSGRIAVKVTPEPSLSFGLGSARFTGEANPRIHHAAHAIGRKLMAHRRELGAWPALPLTQVPVPGFSNHLGACLPMRANPQPGETDRWGRPHGMRRVHVVDSAVFSDLPSEHLTYTIMANAMRIARQAASGALP
jgi:choline dehydrogenase-like flavoprotein